jgi:hypothetical protein
MASSPTLHRVDTYTLGSSNVMTLFNVPDGGEYAIIRPLTNDCHFSDTGGDTDTVDSTARLTLDADTTVALYVGNQRTFLISSATGSTKVEIRITQAAP